jgi:hypothetical protein
MSCYFTEMFMLSIESYQRNETSHSGACTLKRHQQLPKRCVRCSLASNLYHHITNHATANARSYLIAGMANGLFQ